VNERISELTEQAGMIKGQELQIVASGVGVGRSIKMNERIRELAEQAGDYVNAVYTRPVRSKTPGKIWEDGHIGWHEQFNEKFAELIVQECLDIVDNEGCGEGGSIRAMEKIKEHFGVRE
jgi:hypothetical protein